MFWGIYLHYYAYRKKDSSAKMVRDFWEGVKHKREWNGPNVKFICYRYNTWVPLFTFLNTSLWERKGKARKGNEGSWPAYFVQGPIIPSYITDYISCLLYTSDAADE